MVFVYLIVVKLIRLFKKIVYKSFIEKKKFMARRLQLDDQKVNKLRVNGLIEQTYIIK